jgi:hypothetical protein
MSEYMEGSNRFLFVFFILFAPYYWTGTCDDIQKDFPTSLFPGAHRHE